MPDPTPQQTNSAPDRAAVLAELGKIRASNGDGEPAPKVAAKPALAVAPAAAAAADPDPETAVADVEPDDDVVADPDPEVAADQPDAETQKRLEMVTRAEKRSRQALAKDRAEFDLDRRSFLEDQRKHKADVEHLGKLRARAKVDPWTFLREVGGLSEDDAEHAAKTIYANSKAAAANPANRAAVDAAITKREADARVAELEAKLAKIEETDTQRQEHARLTSAAERYMGEVESSVTDASPLVKRTLAKNPQKFAAGIAATYSDLLAADPDGDIPAAADVVKAYEKRRRAELEADDVDIDAYLAKKPSAPAVAAGKTKTIGNGVNGATRPKLAVVKPIDNNGSLTEEARNETLAELAAMRAHRRDDD